MAKGKNQKPANDSGLNFEAPLCAAAEQSVPTRNLKAREGKRRLSVVLELVVRANLQRATRLRQSILQKAFTGELTS